MNIITKGFGLCQSIVTKGYGKVVSIVTQTGKLFRKRNKYLFNLLVPIRKEQLYSFILYIELLKQVSKEYLLIQPISMSNNYNSNITIPINNVRLKRIYKMLRLI